MRFSSRPARCLEDRGNSLRSDRADPTQMSGFRSTIYTNLYICARDHFDAPVEFGRCRHVSVTTAEVINPRRFARFREIRVQKNCGTRHVARAPVKKADDLRVLRLLLSAYLGVIVCVVLFV